ncbi:HAMP domain-containing histidine kinase [Actinocrinis puniceicyclus]|uniref:histidine kinase n=1 Tax=Actinocrinis puniceicyclus TaxID=977794 RepID=A0A8J7WM65_9ACTN|nr:HAMP domain-containing sensor histidine kinase [Actinocrinis puniceicyclus]MBS2962339.1 HAMP domain-containing histidine kinase [Actinocrinis puniceicyclus]
MAGSGARLFGPVGRRLFAAFALVGIGAVTVVAVLAVFSVTRQTDSLVASQRAQVRREVTAALADAYAAAGSWSTADLTAVHALAQAGSANLIVLDTSGGAVTTITASPQTEHGPGPARSASGGPGEHRGTPQTTHGGSHNAAAASGGSGVVGLAAARPAAAPSATPVPTAAGTTTAAVSGQAEPIVVGGQSVGSVLITFPAVAATAAGQAGQAILRQVALAAVVAVVLAAVAALLVTRRTTRPLAALADAAAAVERGESDVAARLRPQVGEFGQVTAAFARMARTLEREDALRRTLVSDVAHELRTPVTILRGTSEQLIDGVTEPTPERLASLYEETLRLERLVEDLSTLAAAQAATLSLRRSPVDLAEVAAQAQRALRPQFEEAALDLRLECRPALVDGDRDRLAQVLTNLLTNALKFTPSGGTVTVATDAGPDESGHDVTRLSVRDTGPGIPAAELPHLFQRFWRGSSAAGRGGSGIGLAVVAELVAAHGGAVRAESPSGGGAVFTVTLPRAPRAPRAVARSRGTGPRSHPG